MPLNLFYTMVQKSQKWPKTQIKGGPALRPQTKSGRKQRETSHIWRGADLNSKMNIGQNFKSVVQNASL